MKKILIVSPCQGAYGGIEAFVLAVAAAVRLESDFALRICFKKTKDFSLQPELTAMLHGEPVMFCERAGAELFAAIRWADLVHIQNAPPDAIALAKLLGKPVALTIHNYMKREWSAHRALWRLGAALAHARWYNSNFVWNTWEPKRKRSGSRKVATVSKLPEGWTAPNERAGFLFVGRWIRNKGIGTLVQAYAAAGLEREKWPLTLIGDGPLRPAIEREIERLCLTTVEICGFVDEATKARRMQQARWVVVPPNTREDFGLTAIEARNLGVPCIITRDGGLPEAGGRQALVCEPGDASGLSRLLEQASRMSESEYAERAERTRAELKAELVPMEFYADVYRQILSGKPLAPA